MNDRNASERASRDDDPTSWFEPLYRDTEPDGDGVPWANMETHPSFQQWLSRHDLKGDGQRALVIGCGMGDDAVELASRGFQVTAFDVSESAGDGSRMQPLSGSSPISSNRQQRGRVDSISSLRSTRYSLFHRNMNRRRHRESLISSAPREDCSSSPLSQMSHGLSKRDRPGC